TSPPVPAVSETIRVNHFDAQSCSDILGLCIHHLDSDDEVRTAVEPRIVHGPETFDPAHRQTSLALPRKVQLYENWPKRILILAVTGGSCRSLGQTDLSMIGYQTELTSADEEKAACMYQIGFNLFYCFKCAVATGHPTIELTEVATLQSGSELEKSKRHQRKSTLKMPQKILGIVIPLRRELAPPAQIIQGIGSDDKTQLGGPRELDKFKMAKAASEELQSVLAPRDRRHGC
ncbi:hypothetical protein PoMZ_08965, partial [Pyricularia oryzae]